MSAKRRLTDADVLWIRKQRARPYPNGKLKSYATLAECVGCTPTHARDIVRGVRRSGADNV